MRRNRHLLFSKWTSKMLALALVIVYVSLVNADEGNIYSPSSSSSYARVQYANKPNITRRFGTFRDPTIKYVSFDELYNKQYGKPKIDLQEVSGVLGNTQTSSVSTHEDGGILEKDDELPLAELPLTYYDDDEDLELAGTHASNHSVIHAEDKIDSMHPTWDEVPDLRNGWTVERQNDVTEPKLTVVKSTSATSIISKTKAKGSPTHNKGLDQVYAYSNMYQNYNDQLNKDSQVDRDGWITTKDDASATWKSTPLPDLREYAHAIGGESADLYILGNEVTTSPPVVMESSWTDKAAFGSPAKPHPKPVLEDRIDTKSTTSKDISFSTAVKFPSQAERTRNNGLQTAWRPFSGPTISPKQTQSNPAKSNLATATIESSTPATNNADTLFYSEAQKAAVLALKNRVPAENPNLMPPNRPTFLVPNNPNRPSIHPGMPPHFLPPQQPFAVRPNELTNQQFLFLPNAAENEVNKMNRPLGPVIRNNGPSGLQFPPVMAQPAEQSTFVHPAPFMHNRQPLPGPPQQQQPQQPPPPPPASFGPQNEPQRNRFPVQVQPRPDMPLRDHTFGLPSDKRLNFGRPTPSGPNRIPSGPVSGMPHLLHNQGRPIAKTQGNTMTIQLPLPRPGPGPIGSSPDNPLPGPPIPLPGIPSGPIVIAGEGPNDNKNNRPPNQLQLFNRHDGPIPGQESSNNMGRPPLSQQQGPFTHRNPNLEPNPHLHNFQLPPPLPPPPQRKQSSSATSLIKSFLSRFFPFARSLSDDNVPMIDIDKFTNSTNITAIAADPSLLAKFIIPTLNSTGPANFTMNGDDGDFLNATTSGFNQIEDVTEKRQFSTSLPVNLTAA